MSVMGICTRFFRGCTRCFGSFWVETGVFLGWVKVWGSDLRSTILRWIVSGQLSFAGFAVAVYGAFEQPTQVQVLVAEVLSHAAGCFCS